MPAGEIQPVALLLDDEAWAREPIRVANDEYGHDVVEDTCSQTRYTCRRCQRFVMVVGTNIYGPAVRERCERIETHA